MAAVQVESDGSVAEACQPDRQGDAPDGADSGEGVAYQGRPGAFGEAAARSIGRAGEARIPCATFEAVVDAIASGRARQAVLPVFNVIAGGVGAAIDLVATRSEVAVVGAVTVPVALALIAPVGVRIEDVRRVRSHPVALAQCRAFFRAHPEIVAVADFDTAGAVEAVVADARGDEAALAHADAARVYGGSVIADAMQDHAANATRFLVLARTAAAAPPVDDPNAAVAVWTGADLGLTAVLDTLAAAGWHLSHLERRPAPDLLTATGPVPGAPVFGRFVLDLTGTGAVPDIAGLVVRGAYAAA